MYDVLRHNLTRAFCALLGFMFAMFLLLALFSNDDPASRGDWWTLGLDYYMQAYAPHVCLVMGIVLLAYAIAYAVTALLDQRRERAVAQSE